MPMLWQTVTYFSNSINKQNWLRTGKPDGRAEPEHKLHTRSERESQEAFHQLIWGIPVSQDTSPYLETNPKRRREMLLHTDNLQTSIESGCIRSNLVVSPCERTYLRYHKNVNLTEMWDEAHGAWNCCKVALKACNQWTAKQGLHLPTLLFLQRIH